MENKTGMLLYQFLKEKYFRQKQSHEPLPMLQKPILFLTKNKIFKCNLVY